MYNIVSGDLLCSSKQLTGANSANSNVTTRLRLENERLRREVSELRKLVTASGAPTALDVVVPTNPDLDSLEGPEKIQALETELAHAREALSGETFCKLLLYKCCVCGLSKKRTRKLVHNVVHTKLTHEF